MKQEVFVESLSIEEIGGKTVIAAPTGAQYLNEFMPTLPKGIVSKNQTGCGATTVMLENEENVIIACPTKQLVNNKVAQYPNGRCPYKLLAVQKDVGQYDIEEYIKECAGIQPIKIMVTYDSFPRAKAAIEKEKIDCHVVIDEWQEILKAYVYRNRAIRNLLKELHENPNVTYLSATPIPLSCRPIEITNLHEYEIQWSNSPKIIPYLAKVNHPFSYAARIIQMHKTGYPFQLRGHEVQEYFFFVNSVSSIMAIVKAAGLTPDDTRIICGDTEINHLKLGNFRNETATGDNNKPFTFCTKTAFCGIDFYSKAGLVIILSEGFHPSSLLDISTDIIQIAGRIRSAENPFKNIILHFFNTGIVQSKEAFLQRIKRNTESVQQTIGAYQNLPEQYRGAIIEKIDKNNPDEWVVYNPDTKELEFDEMKKTYLEYQFDNIDKAYSTIQSIQAAYEREEFETEDVKLIVRHIEDNLQYCRIKPFEFYYKLYSSERKRVRIGTSNLLQNITQQYSLVKDAYYYLGDEIVEKLKYSEKKVIRLLSFKYEKTQAAFKEMLPKYFQVGGRYSYQEIKAWLEHIFQCLEIKITPKAILLRAYYEVKKVKIGSRPRRDGFEIKRKLFLAFSSKFKRLAHYSKAG